MPSFGTNWASGRAAVFYICTIQKFCDRKEDKIGLINNRRNIICFSDEAHRTQLEHSKKIQFSKDSDENMKALVSKPYAKVLREAFPAATFVGFTGTPIAETYQTFGDEIDRYTMDQAVADGLTVSIKYHPRIAKVLLDKKKVKEIETYYKRCADEGATKDDIEASKAAMSSMEVILGEPSRLERLAVDIHDHYVSACGRTRSGCRKPWDRLVPAAPSLLRCWNSSKKNTRSGSWKEKCRKGNPPRRKNFPS